MLSDLKNYLLSSPAESHLNFWVLAGVMLVFLIIGAMLAKAFAKRFGDQADMIALRTRDNQSEFDLANRDITKVRKDLDVELAKHGEYIRRWKRN